MSARAEHGISAGTKARLGDTKHTATAAKATRGKSQAGTQRRRTLETRRTGLLQRVLTATTT